MKSKVAIYVRVSTLEQAESGYSVDEQIDKLTKYCDIKDWQVYDTYVDPGYSGSNTKRPGMQRLIKEAKNKRFDTILVYKLDRLSRSQKDTLYLIEEVFNKNNISFVSLNENFDTSTSFGKAMIGILSVFAQLEREQITERMQMGKMGRAKSGKAMSWTRPPFGYIYEEGKYLIDELRAPIAKSIFEAYLSGISITKLRDKMNEEGHIGKDIKWSYRTIRQMLDNPVYAGYTKYKDDYFKGNHEPIITKETFDKVQEQLVIRQKKAYAENNNPRPFQSKYMLSGIIRCGYCGAPLIATFGNVRKDGSRSKKYQCTNRIVKSRVTVYNDNKKCDSGFYQMAELENEVLATMENLRVNPHLVKELSKSEEEDHSEQYQERINQIEKQLKKLSELYLNDVLTLEDMQIKAKTLKQESSSLIEKMTIKKESSKKTKQSEVVQYLKNKKIPIYEESYDHQKIIVNRFIDKIAVTAEGIDIFWKFA